MSEKKVLSDWDVYSMGPCSAQRVKGYLEDNGMEMGEFFGVVAHPNEVGIVINEMRKVERKLHFIGMSNWRSGSALTLLLFVLDKKGVA